MFRSPDAKPVKPSVEAARLAGMRKIAGAPALVLVDSLFAAETRHLDDGTDETNMVRIRVTADEWRNLPPDMDRRLMDLLREFWPVKDAGDA